VILIIDSSRDDCPEFEADQELQRALALLHAALIRPLGGGRFLDGSNYIVLAFESDGSAALAALREAGIQASELKPINPANSRPLVEPGLPGELSLLPPHQLWAASGLRRTKS
jgi:hypothetical protein